MAGCYRADPTAQQPHEAPMTTTRHRPRCTRPGWQVESSRTLRAVQIARCVECEAIELRTPTLTAANPYEGETR